MPYEELDHWHHRTQERDKGWMTLLYENNRLPWWYELGIVR